MPADPDPTPEQLAAIERTYAMYGGVANARVVDRFWFGYIHYSRRSDPGAAGRGLSYDFD